MGTKNRFAGSAQYPSANLHKKSKGMGLHSKGIGINKIASELGIGVGGN
jgi:hypothetical protein